MQEVFALVSGKATDTQRVTNLAGPSDGLLRKSGPRAADPIRFLRFAASKLPVIVPRAKLSCDVTGWGQAKKGVEVSRAAIEMGDLSVQLLSLVGRVFRGSWVEYAKSADLYHAQVRRNGLSTSFTVISSSPLSAQSLKSALDWYQVDWEWFEVDGERVVLFEPKKPALRLAALPEFLNQGLLIEKPSSFFGMSGIYAIVNLINGKFYIGSSTSVGRRIAEHIGELRAGRHYNARLKNAWNKYGESAFAFVLVESVEPSKCKVSEQNYLDQTRSWHRHVGYNMAWQSTGGVPGEENAQSKLTDAVVRRMRWERAVLGETYSLIAARYGVGKSAAKNAVIGKMWGHVDGALPSTDMTNRRTHNATFTDDQVVLLRQLYADGASLEQLVNDYGLCRERLKAAITGKAYKHVPSPVQMRPSPAPAEKPDVPRCPITGMKESKGKTLTAEQVIEMRKRRRLTGESYHVIAADYGVWPRTARQAIQGHRWAYLNDIEPPVVATDDVPPALKCNTAKLTEQQVIDMRRLRKAGAGSGLLAKMYGIGEKTARDATNGRTWTHLNEVEEPYVFQG
jgi:group I intron endonuclease